MSKCNPITRIIPASFAWITLLFSTGVFFVFPCRYLMSVYSIAIPVFQGIVTFFVTVNFGLATFVNPGAIPKAASEEIKNVVSSPTYQDIEIRGVRVRLKWCVTCQFFRPPRCVHCGICDTCIETFDHHCPWVNNCIGRRNYRYFFMFLLWLTIHMVSILSLCALYMKDHLNQMKQLESIMTLSVIGIIVLLFIPIFGLTGFHVMVMTRGLTTNEQVTGKFIDVRSPYNRGCLKNIFYSLCNSPLPRYSTKSSSYNHLVNQHFAKDTKSVKSPNGSDLNIQDKYFAVQYQFVGKSDYSLSNPNESGPSLLNLSLNDTLCANSYSMIKSKSSRALTPPVPVRLDYSRRSLPPHNKFHATTLGYLVQGQTQKNVSKIDSDQAILFYTPDQNSTLDYGISARDAASSHFHKSRGEFHEDQYAIHNPINSGKASDTCCLSNQTADKLQELANRSVINGQCTDISVLEVFPKACSSFQSTPSKELHNGQQLLIAQNPQLLYLNNCVDCQHGNHCQTGMPSDFIRTPGNRPLSFVKAMEMSEALDWNSENAQRFRTSDCTLQLNSHTSVSNCPDPKINSHEISYEISV